MEVIKQTKLAAFAGVAQPAEALEGRSNDVTTFETITNYAAIKKPRVCTIC